MFFEIVLNSSDPKTQTLFYLQCSRRALLVDKNRGVWVDPRINLAFDQTRQALDGDITPEHHQEVRIQAWEAVKDHEAIDYHSPSQYALSAAAHAVEGDMSCLELARKSVAWHRIHLMDTDYSEELYEKFLEEEKSWQYRYLLHMLGTLKSKVTLDENLPCY